MGNKVPAGMSTTTPEKFGAKYCPIELEGDIKYYICPHYEQCCKLGCCLSSSVEAHHLWYYWMIVFLMFALCLAGGYWYHLKQHPPDIITHRRRQRTSVSFRPGQTAIVMEPIFRNEPPVHSAPPQSNSLVRSKPSPYYQLYGPPPSYDSVIAESEVNQSPLNAGKQTENLLTEEEEEQHSQAQSLSRTNQCANEGAFIV